MLMFEAFLCQVSVPVNADAVRSLPRRSCISVEEDCNNNALIWQCTNIVDDHLKNGIHQHTAGPFVVPMSVELRDVKLIKYIMDEDLDEGYALNNIV